MNRVGLILFLIFISPVKSVFANDLTPANTFAVVELYTSEGCSSCPPADLLLTKLTNLAAAKNVPVYTLSFHVDYWNDLGWRDPFSREQFSNRQRRYAEVNKSESVYTPQMIVNGVDNFSGFREDLAQKAIDRALSLSRQIKITLNTLALKTDQIGLAYKINGIKKNQDLLLQVALVEKDLTSHVPRGENTGRTLRHSNVVRTFQTFALTSLKENKSIEGQFSLKWSSTFDRKKTLIIAYIQNPKTMEILGAAQLKTE